MKSLIAMAAFVVSATTFAAPKANLRLTSYNAGLAHTFVMYAEVKTTK